MRRFFLVSLLLALLPLSFSITGNPVYVARANPSTLTVPGQYPTIGEAINAAGPGDTIQVSGGTYLENLNISKSGGATTFVLTGKGGAQASPRLVREGLHFFNFGKNLSGLFPCQVH